MRRTSSVLVTATAAALMATPAIASAGNNTLVLDVIDSGSQTVQLAKLKASGGTPSLVTTPQQGVWASCAGWRPGKNKAVFTQQDRGAQTPSFGQSINLDGTAQTVVKNTTGVYCLSSNAAGSLFGWVGFSDGKESVGVIKPNGNKKRTLAATKKDALFGAAISPDGKRLAYTKVVYKAGGGVQSSDILIVDIATGAKTNITKSKDKQFDEPSWIGNNKLVAVRSNVAIVTMNARGTNTTKVTKGAGTYVASPVVSPSGNHLAYLTCQGDCGDPDLAGTGTVWRVKVDGSGKKQLWSSSGDLQPNTSLAYVQ